MPTKVNKALRKAAESFTALDRHEHAAAMYLSIGDTTAAKEAYALAAKRDFTAATTTGMHHKTIEERLALLKTASEFFDLAGNTETANRLTTTIARIKKDPKQLEILMARVLNKLKENAHK